jgi:hypothetical protein
MKNLKIGLLALVVLVTTFSSCKKLDLFPYNSIEQSQSFKTVKDAKTWNAGLYAAFRGRQYGAYTFSTDVQADQLNASLDFGNRNGNPHRWGPSFLADDYTIRDVWAAYYTAITNINVGITGFEEVKPTTPAEIAELDRYKGDAYFARAFYYHQLTLRWAKAYSPASAATDLAVPLITVYDVNAQPTRATVKQVYDQILSDITQAKKYLGSFAGVVGAKTFNNDVVLALEARVKLHMQDWAGAYTAANTLITGGKYKLTTTAADFKNYWHNDGNQESIYQCFVSKPNELANTNSIYLGFIPATGKFTPDFIPSQWVVDAYGATDIRKATYFEQKSLTISGLTYNNIFLVNKYPGNTALFTGAATNYQHAPKVFRIAEMYLIAAEAAAKSASAANALTALNALRVARGLTASSASGTALMTDIMDERFRELAFEGFRLDDLKRLNLGFTRTAAQNVNAINVGANYNTLSVPSSDPKFIWGLPSNDVTINKNLVQNTGW